MISTASSSVSSRTSTSGHRSPRMCSLSASPVPMPKRKVPFDRTADVATAWARIAGWIRTVGHVTPVVTGSSGTACANAPIIDHTNGELPCASVHG